MDGFSSRIAFLEKKSTGNDGTMAINWWRVASSQFWSVFGHFAGVDDSVVFWGRFVGWYCYIESLVPIDVKTHTEILLTALCSYLCLLFYVKYDTLYLWGQDSPSSFLSKPPNLHKEVKTSGAALSQSDLL